VKNTISKETSAERQRYDLLPWTILNDLSCFHHCNIVAYICSSSNVMCDEQKSDTTLCYIIRHTYLLHLNI
jgi:hypothetical protein